MKTKGEVAEIKVRKYIDKFYSTLTKEQLIDGLGNTMYALIDEY